MDVGVGRGAEGWKVVGNTAVKKARVRGPAKKVKAELKVRSNDRVFRRRVVY